MQQRSISPVRCTGLLLLLLFTAFTASAQKTSVPTGVRAYKYISPDKTITDTIDAHFDSATVTLYAAPNGGFASGNSGYNEEAKVQEFDVDTSYTIEGFLYWFGYKEQQSAAADSSSITLIMYDMDSTASVNGQNRRVPRTVMRSERLLVEDIDTTIDFSSGVNLWSISPVVASRNYGVGFRLDGVDIKDTIALYTSSDEDPPLKSVSWEFWNGSWNTMVSNWGLDIDFAIFPLIDMTTAGIEDEQYFDGLKMSIYPNPADQVAAIDFDTKFAGEVSVTMFDLSGKAVATIRPGTYPQGEHRLQIETGMLVPGNYILSLGVGSAHRITKKFIVAR